LIWCFQIVDCPATVESGICPLTAITGFEYQWILPVGCSKFSDEFSNWFFTLCTFIDGCAWIMNPVLFTQGIEVLFKRSLIQLFNGQVRKNISHLSQLGVVFNHDSYKMVVSGRQDERSWAFVLQHICYIAQMPDYTGRVKHRTCREKLSDLASANNEICGSRNNG